MPPDFDKAYYDRFYRNPKTRATSPAEVRRQAQFLAAYVRHLQLPVSSIVDFGCGLGTLLRALARELKGASIQGVEHSKYLCEQYGWVNGSVVDCVTSPADLVVCHDVLAYLPNRQATQAINNIAEHAIEAAYISVICEEDLQIMDEARTDQEQIIRPARWYLERLLKHFVNVGGGLYLKKPLSVPVWRLEQGGVSPR